MLTSFDIFATAGGQNKAVAESFTATASSAGAVTIQFVTVKDNAQVNGIEVQPAGGGGTGNTVTVTNPGTQTWTVGTAASLQITATDSASGQTLTYSATGLPAGLSDQLLDRADLRDPDRGRHRQRHGDRQGHHRRVRLGHIRAGPSTPRQQAAPAVQPAQPRPEHRTSSPRACPPPPSITR